jgi:hypothetical protein
MRRNRQTLAILAVFTLPLLACSDRTPGRLPDATTYWLDTENTAVVEMAPPQSLQRRLTITTIDGERELGTISGNNVPFEFVGAEGGSPARVRVYLEEDTGNPRRLVRRLTFARTLPQGGNPSRALVLVQIPKSEFSDWKTAIHNPQKETPQ